MTSDVISSERGQPNPTLKMNCINTFIWFLSIQSREKVSPDQKITHIISASCNLNVLIYQIELQIELPCT